MMDEATNLTTEEESRIPSLSQVDSKTSSTCKQQIRNL